MMLTISVDPAIRSRRLSYYHANKELMNLQSFVNKLNHEGREPMYAHKKAYLLFKDADGKWRFPDSVKEEMKERSKKRLEEESRSIKSEIPVQDSEVIRVDLLAMMEDMMQVA